MTQNRLYLFGGEKSWSSTDWTASDDRVRGGKSQSYLDVSKSTARFHGNLDIKTLGGAGFASQRTTGEDRHWDLTAFDGIEVEIEKADEKHYTFVLKDYLLPKNPENGREQSTISYEYDFYVNAHSESTSQVIFIPWAGLQATYRGKVKDDAPKLNVRQVKRFSFMMRSFFGDQQGPFSLTVKSISAVSVPKAALPAKDAVIVQKDAIDLSELEKGYLASDEAPEFSKISVRRYITFLIIGGLALLLLTKLRCNSMVIQQ